MYLMEIEEIGKERNNKIFMIIFAIIVSVMVVAAIAISIFLAILEEKEKEQHMLAKTFMNHEEYIKIEMLLPSKPENFREKVEKIYHLEEEKRRVFLTFDDGPSKTVTPLILDLLKEQGIKATFFELGSRIELYPEITKRVYEEGHYLANHGYSHIYGKIYESPEKVLEEYNKTEDAIRNAIQNPEYRSELFRFPGGSTGGKYKEIKKQAIELLNANAIAHVDWNALTGDAEGKCTKEEMLEYVKATMGEKRSVVILMHDAGDKILTYEILPELIQYLQEKGYEFKNFYDL